MKVARTLGIALIFLWLAPDSRAHSWLAECTISFSNEFALTWVYGQARATFASSTGLSSSGQPELCDPARHGACWTYRERCGSRGYVNVEEKPRLVKRKIPTNQPGKYKVVIDEVRYGHFHLGFENPTDCFADGGDGLGVGFGRMSGANCIALDWKREPRIAMTHDSSQPLRIWVEDNATHAARLFDVASITVRDTVAVQLWYKAAEDGSWYGWHRLAPGVHDISGWTWEITEMVVSAAAGETGPIAVDNIVVRN
jgi:hypothetical protein